MALTGELEGYWKCEPGEVLGKSVMVICGESYEGYVGVGVESR